MIFPNYFHLREETNKPLAHLAFFLLVSASINNSYADTLALDNEVKKSTSSCSAYLKVQPTQTKNKLKQEINLADMRAAYCHLYNALGDLGTDNGFYSTLSSHKTEDGNSTEITFRFDKNPC